MHPLNVKLLGLFRRKLKELACCFGAHLADGWLPFGLLLGQKKRPAGHSWARGLRLSFRRGRRGRRGGGGQISFSFHFEI